MTKIAIFFTVKIYKTILGIQYSRTERDIFACFSNALPERWGRTLFRGHLIKFETASK